MLPPGVPAAARTLAARARARDDLALARARAAQAARLVARASRSSPPRPSPISRRASTSRRRRSTSLLLVALFCARAGSSSRRAIRRRCCRSSRSALALVVVRAARRRSTLYDNDAYSERIEEALLIAVGAPRVPRALALAPAVPGAPPAAGRARARRPSSSASTAPTASRTSRCGATRATSSRRAASRSSPIASSAAPRSSPATRSATPAERRELVAEFVRVAHAKGWRVAVAGAVERGARGLRRARLQVDLPRRRGGHPARPSSRSTAARSARCASRSRGSRRAATRSGCSRRPMPTRRCARELRAVSEEWRGNWPERGFTMAMDALFAYPDTVLAVAVGPDGSRRRLPAARAVARERGLLARVDAAPPRHAERADGVPDHRDGRLGAGARGRRGLAQLRGLRRLPARRRDAPRPIARAALACS